MDAIPTSGKSTKQHVPKSAAAAKGLGEAPTTAEGAGERPRCSQRKPAWMADYQNGLKHCLSFLKFSLFFCKEGVV